MELNPAIAIDRIDFDLMARLCAAAVIGLLLGIDREVRAREAGLRTHGLICFTAAAMTVSAIALHNQIGGDRADVLRLYAATGSVVGLVGAGLIIFSRGKIRNLTTAAHIWLTAVIGIACGAAQWPLVLFGTVISILMLSLLGIAEARWRGAPWAANPDPASEAEKRGPEG